MCNALILIHQCIRAFSPSLTTHLHELALPRQTLTAQPDVLSGPHGMCVRATADLEYESQLFADLEEKGLPNIWQPKCQSLQVNRCNAAREEARVQGSFLPPRLTKLRQPALDLSAQCHLCGRWLDEERHQNRRGLGRDGCGEQLVGSLGGVAGVTEQVRNPVEILESLDAIVIIIKHTHNPTHCNTNTPIHTHTREHTTTPHTQEIHNCIRQLSI
jgi:hypothetical protein